MSCDVGYRHSSDSKLLWLWCRLAAVALIGPLAWEPPYAMGVALKNKKQKKRVREGDLLEKDHPKPTPSGWTSSLTLCEKGL